MDTAYGTLTPLEAYHAVMRFAAQRGEQVLRLAFHAAMPQVLQPDLLHLLRLNFVTESLDDPAAEADVLFAPFCADLGNGYFRFQRNARLQLLTQLDPAYADESTLRSRQVAGFLLAYCDREGGGLTASNDLVYAAYLEVERWVALAFFDPDAAASQLAAVVKQSCEEGAVAARMRIGGLASALATPLARHPDLLAYAAGVEALEAGDVARAEDLLQPLGEREIQVGGVTLRSPRSVLEERSRKRVEKTERPPEKIEPGTEAGKETSQPGLIFISYSRKDQRWVEAVRAALAPLEQRYGVTVWSEAEIASGRQWEREVADAIDRAEVAIVLLSPAYLASEVRMHDELPRLVERARIGTLDLAWTCVERCDWKATPLAAIQAVHDPDEPLSALTRLERERAIARLAEQVAAFFPPSEKPEAQAQPERQPPGRVFLVYRREDTAGHAGRLHDRLRQRFGDDAVFMDSRDIPPSRDFSEVIDRAVSTAPAIMVVIGPRWLDARDADGRRRLDDPDDIVRQEVAAALRRGIPVIPVLVGGARMPASDSLPDDLVPLTRRNAIELSDAQWDADCARLFEAIEGFLASPGVKDRPGSEQEPGVSPRAGRPIARIYISSTHADLGEQRNAVYRTLRQLRHDVIGMEDYAATDMGPLQKSFDDIASCDALILVVAWRYGYVPPDPVENPESLSVVELEYRQARRLGKPIFVFMVDREAPWKHSLMDSSTGEGEHGERIARFRQELARDHVVAFFRTPDELATLVAKAVTHWTQTPTQLESGTVFRDGDDCPEMVVIPAGTFTMGSPHSEPGRTADEGPQHKVTIPRRFGLGRYQVTVGEFRRFVAAAGHKTEAEWNPREGIRIRDDRKNEWVWSNGRDWRDPGFAQGENHPVVGVSWNDALAYAKWLSEKTGGAYRLPSEAEWEYAARAGTSTRYPWGGEPESNRANFRNSGARWSGKQTAPVGSFQPNAFGLHDMIGNAWEWMQDCWNESYEGAPADGSAWESGDCGQRVVRGGSWFDLPEFARVAHRLKFRPTYRSNTLGFRLARTL